MPIKNTIPNNVTVVIFNEWTQWIINEFEKLGDKAYATKGILPTKLSWGKSYVSFGHREEHLTSFDRILNKPRTFLRTKKN